MAETLVNQCNGEIHFVLEGIRYIVPASIYIPDDQIIMFPLELPDT